MLFPMLYSASLFLSRRNKTYSNTKAKSGVFLLSLPLDMRLTLSLKLSGRLDLTEVSVDHLKRGERNLGSRGRIYVSARNFPVSQRLRPRLDGKTDLQKGGSARAYR